MVHKYNCSKCIVVGLFDFLIALPALMVKLRLLLGIIIIEREKRKEKKRKVKRKLCVWTVEVHWFRLSCTDKRREYVLPTNIHFMVLCFWKSAERVSSKFRSSLK